MPNTDANHVKKMLKKPEKAKFTVKAQRRIQQKAELLGKTWQVYSEELVTKWVKEFLPQHLAAMKSEWQGAGLSLMFDMDFGVTVVDVLKGKERIIMFMTKEEADNLRQMMNTVGSKPRIEESDNLI